ncbi:MAG: hypothetical protein KOO60_10895 [Gemmatimonadales bacterium]|nr:hypothetical protein [Gemmatimonadales bacterium]
MRVIVDKADLIVACKSARPFVPRKSTLPVLHTVRLATPTDNLHIYGTDLDNTVCVRVSAIVSEPGAVCVPLDVLTSAIAGISDGDIELVSTDGEMLDVLVDGKVCASLTGMPSDEFPHLGFADSSPANSALGFDVSALHGTLERVTPFSSRDETRPSLCGVALESQSGVGVVFASSDGHRLAAEFLPLNGADVWPGVGDPKHIRVYDGAGMRALVKLCKAEARAQKRMDMTSAVLVSEIDASGQGVGRLRIDFWASDTSVWVRECEGPYPRYAQVRPSEYCGASLDTDTDALSVAVKAVLPAANKETHQIVFQMQDRFTRLTACTPGVGELTQKVRSDGSGVLRVGYNGRYVLDLCKALPKHAQIVIAPMSESGAALVTSSAVPNFWGLLMPLRIST